MLAAVRATYNPFEMELRSAFPVGTQACGANMTDEQLMVRVKEGCEDSAAVLFYRYRHFTLSIVLRVVRDFGEAEDVTQRVFFEVFRSVERFDPAKGTARAWIAQYAHHRAINHRHYLNVRKFYEHENIEDHQTCSAGRNTCLARYAAGEQKRLVQQGLAKLGGHQKRVIELATYDGLSMREIVDRTGESYASVRHHYYRGLRKLRLFLEQNRARTDASEI